MPLFDEVEVGLEIPVRTEVLGQDRLIRYAGASGDFNPLHWDPEFAAQVSPTGAVIAHGMLNMGFVSAVVTDWAGGPEKVLQLSTSFRAACPEGAAVTYGGAVVELDAPARTATLEVWALLEDGSAVVDRRRSRARVQLE